MKILEFIRVLLGGDEYLDRATLEIGEHIVQIGRYNDNDNDMVARVDNRVDFMPKDEIDGWIRERL